MQTFLRVPTIIKEQYYVIYVTEPIRAACTHLLLRSVIQKKNGCRSSYCVIGSGEGVENWFQ